MSEQPGFSAPSLSNQFFGGTVAGDVVEFLGTATGATMQGVVAEAPTLAAAALLVDVALLV